MPTEYARSPVDKQYLVVDLNLGRLPLCIPGRHDLRDIIYNYTYLVEKSRFTASWRVIADPKFGLPGIFDLKVLLAVYKTGQAFLDTGYANTPYVRDRIIELPSVSALMRIVGVNATGGNVLARVKDSIRRLFNTRLVSDSAFQHKDNNYYIKSPDPFRLVDNYSLNCETTDSGVDLKTNWIQLGEPFWSNLVNRHTILVPHDILLGFRSEFAALLYLHLLYWFTVSNSGSLVQWRIDWQRLANMLGMNWDSAWRLRERLKPAFNELSAMEIASVTWLDNMLVFHRGRKLIRYSQETIIKPGKAAISSSSKVKSYSLQKWEDLIDNTSDVISFADIRKRYAMNNELSELDKAQLGRSIDKRRAMLRI